MGQGMNYLPHIIKGTIFCSKIADLNQFNSVQYITQAYYKSIKPNYKFSIVLWFSMTKMNVLKKKLYYSKKYRTYINYSKNMVKYTKMEALTKKD